MQKSVLMADDEIESLGFLVEALRDRGYRVVTAETGEDAVKQAEAEFFDIVLMDFGLPGINGLEAFRRIKRVSPLSTVIMITAAMPPREAREAETEGSFAVVYKPFRIESLVEKIDAALGRMTAIVVDGRFDDRETLKRILEQKGCRCVSLPDGNGVFDMLKRKKPDVVFLDVTAPGGGGFALLERLRNHYPEIDVIMMMSSGDLEHMEQAAEMGALTCLCRPLSAEKILTIVQRIKIRSDSPS